jgi:hypothetical protein
MTDPARPILRFKDIAVGVLEYLLHFAKNPVQGMKSLPDWNWPTLIITQSSIAAFFGIISGILLNKFTKIINGFIAMPISAIFVTSVLSLAFYYVFLFAYKREMNFKKIFTIFVLSSLPWLVLSPLVDLLAPLKIIGIISSGLLLIVGLNEHSQLPKFQVNRLVIGIIVTYVLYWMVQMIQFDEKKRDYRKMATPQSLDILEKEFKTE